MFRGHKVRGPNEHTLDEYNRRRKVRVELVTWIFPIFEWHILKEKS
jgi:hypothetical protein